MTSPARSLTLLASGTKRHGMPLTLASKRTSKIAIDDPRRAPPRPGSACRQSPWSCRTGRRAEPRHRRRRSWRARRHRRTDRHDPVAGGGSEAGGIPAIASETLTGDAGALDEAHDVEQHDEQSQGDGDGDVALSAALLLLRGETAASGAAGRPWRQDPSARDVDQCLDEKRDEEREEIEDREGEQALGVAAVLRRAARSPWPARPCRRRRCRPRRRSSNARSPSGPAACRPARGRGCRAGSGGASRPDRRRRAASGTPARS